MMISTGKLLLFFSLILLLTGVKGLEVCQCNTITTELYFTNDEPTVQHYSLQKSGLASTWSVLTPSTFSLNPGQTELVVVFSRVDCRVAEGVYPLTVKAVSEDDLISKSVDFKVSSCRSITVAPIGELSACVNKEFVVPLNITNSGNYDEGVNLTSSAGNLSIQVLNLESGDSQIVNLSLIPDQLGVKPVIVTASWITGKSESIFEVDVTECSEFTASLSADYINLCEDEDEVINFTVVNDGTGKQFFFNVSSLFLDLPQSVFLAPNEVFFRDLTVYSGCESGVSPSLIKVWAEGADVVELPLVVNVKGCYQPIVVSGKRSDAVCACEVVNYSFDVYNPGFEEIIYALTSSAGLIYHNGSVVDSVSLEPGESLTLFVNHSIPCSYSGSLNLSLTATSISTCSKSSAGFVELMIDSWAECQSVSVQGQPLVTCFNESPFTVPVSVKNIGSRPTSYSLVVSGSAMSNLLGISKSFVTLDPGESEEIELTVDPGGITGSFINVQAFSTDNLASDSAVINFGDSFISRYDFYFLLIPSAVTILLVLLLLRSKFFKKGSNNKPSGKKIKIKKAEIKKK